MSRLKTITTGSRQLLLVFICLVGLVPLTGAVEKLPNITLFMYQAFQGAHDA